MGDEADYLDCGEDYYYAYNDDEDEEVVYKNNIDSERPSSKQTRKKRIKNERYIRCSNSFF